MSDDPLPQAMRRLKDLWIALTCYPASGLGEVEQRRRRGDGSLQPGPIMASTRVFELAGAYGGSGIQDEPFVEMASTIAQEFDNQLLATRSLKWLSSADLDQLREAAEAAVAVFMAGYGNARQTFKVRERVVDGISEVIRRDDVSATNRRPTEPEIRVTIDELFPIQMPGIADAERAVQALLRKKFGYPADRWLVREILDGYQYRRRPPGRPSKR